jgi:hypothetical protein
MCACKETDVRESLINCTLASGEGHSSCREMCHPHYHENSVFSLAEGGVLPYITISHISASPYKIIRHITYIVIHNNAPYTTVNSGLGVAFPCTTSKC